MQLLHVQTGADASSGQAAEEPVSRRGTSDVVDAVPASGPVQAKEAPGAALVSCVSIASCCDDCLPSIPSRGYSLYNDST